MARARLSARERRIAAATFEAILPSNSTENLALGAADVDMDGFIDDVIETYPPNLAFGIKALLHLLNITALIRTGWSYAALPLEKRQTHFERWYGSRIYVMRQAATTIKTLAALGFLGFPEVQAELGYIKNRAVSPLGDAPLKVTPRSESA